MGILVSRYSAASGHVTDRTDRLFLAALATIMIVYLAVCGYYLQATAIRVPVYDLLAWILHYADTWQHGDWWGYLWQPHNEHRLIFTRLLLLADIVWFRGTTMPFMAFSLACLGGMIGLIMWEVAASKLPANLELTLVLCVPLFLATTYIVVDCSMPALGVYVHTAAFFILALVFLDGAGEEERFVTLRRIIAMLAAAGAAFGIAGGLIAWPVLLWAGWRGGLKRAWLLPIAAVGLAFLVLCLMGIRSAALLGSLEPIHLLLMLDYLLRFLGLPWSHAASLVWVARIIGAFILVTGLGVILLRSFLEPPRGRLDRIALGMLLFALLIAVLAAIGRGRCGYGSADADPLQHFRRHGTAGAIDRRRPLAHPRLGSATRTPSSSGRCYRCLAIADGAAAGRGTCRGGSGEAIHRNLSQVCHRPVD
jgi:hypothetical protein